MSKDHNNNISNPTDNRPFHDVLETRISRRKMLTGSLALAVTSFFGGTGIALVAKGGQPGPNLPKPNSGGLLGFAPAPNNNGLIPQISPDYQFQIILPWGDPIQPGGLSFASRYPLAPTEQAQRIGIGHDGMWFFSINGSSEHGVLVLNNEFGDNSVVLGRNPGADNDEVQPLNLEEVRSSQHAHGVSVIEIQKINGVWQTIATNKARRIHVNTPVAFSGPVAGHALLNTPAGNAPAGTVNNCAMGHTPWGTYLACEENFNGYFGAKNAWKPTKAQQRYGFSETGFDYGWYKFDPRFDLSNPDYINEENRFGWVVEIDPMDASRAPVKKTALGRCKHEGAWVTVGRGGRVVVYMGDDERFDYIYKFVSDDNWMSMRARGMSPLDHGRLYVARFNDDGTGDWLELIIDNPALAAKFADQAEVLTFARLAADALGATPMDRPEWTTVAPNGDVFCTLTNNTRRKETNAANPLAPNPDGHIIKWRDSDNHVGLTFEWDIFLLAKDTRLENGGDEDWEFTDPDGLWADPDGRLFIQTDGGQPPGRQNQMVVADIFSGELRRLFAGVNGDEITGITHTPDRRTMFINIQHPGVILQDDDGNPVPGSVPRDATIVITRKNGGIIGS